MKRTIILACMMTLGLMNAYEARAAYDYSVHYVKEHLLYSSGDEVNVIDVDLEWPEIIDGADMQPLNTFLIKKLFDVDSSNFSEGYEQFKASFGKPVTEQFAQLPADDKMCYADVSLKLLSRSEGRFVSFELISSVRPAEASSHKAREESRLVTYDLMKQKVMLRDDVLRPNRIATSFDNISFLVPEDYDAGFVTNLSIDDACLIDKCLLMSISFGDASDNIYSFRKVFLPKSMEYYMGIDARKLLKPTKKKMVKTQLEAESLLNGQPIYTRVDQSPKFGMEGMTLAQYIGRNVKEVDDKINGQWKGQVMVEFVVDQEGNTQQVRVIKSMAAGYDREAVRVVKGLPRWKPALIGDVPVNMRTAIVIAFNEDD